MSYHPLELSRRQLLKVGAGVGASTLLTPALYADTVDTQAHIVIIGGGASGMAMANLVLHPLSFFVRETT